MTYRKIGGIHWLAIGRLRIALCLTAKRQRLEPRWWLEHQWIVLAIGTAIYGLILGSIMG